MILDPAEAKEQMQAAMELLHIHYGQTQTGRLLSALGNDSQPKRRELGLALLATLLQSDDSHALSYLEQMTGHTPGVPVNVQDNEELPPLVEYVRPNGDIYYARPWGDYLDVEVLKMSREDNCPVLLIGPPGTGKTAMVEAAFGDELITVVLTGETRVSSLVGGFLPDGKDGWRWSDGPLLRAVRDGRPILLDEILLADPEILAVLYPLMDGRGFLDVEDNHDIGVVAAAEGFYIIGAGNPNVPGAKMSPALLSRFPVHVEVTTDWDLAERLGVDSVIVHLASSMSDRHLNSHSLSWSPQFRELLAFSKLEKKRGRKFALANLMRLVPEADYEEVRIMATRVIPSLPPAARI